MPTGDENDDRFGNALGVVTDIALVPRAHATHDVFDGRASSPLVGLGGGGGGGGSESRLDPPPQLETNSAMITAIAGPSRVKPSRVDSSMNPAEWRIFMAVLQIKTKAHHVPPP